MRALKSLLLGLLFSFAIQLHAGECKLSSVLPYPYTCNDYMLSYSLPAQESETVITLPIPFDLFEEQHAFYGLAKYYNGSRPVEMNGWTGLKGRYLSFLLQADRAELTRVDNAFLIKWPAHTPVSLNIYLGPTTGEFSSIEYSYLWSWLAFLCRGMESILLMLGGVLGNAWGLAIIALAVLFKLIFLPLQLWVTKLQAEMDRCEAILKPRLKHIKSQFDGEEAHHLIMAEYKKLGITPFYGMKPLIGPVFQLPIQIAIFNVLGEMPELVGASFLWIKSLAYPDTLFYLFNHEFNLLPILMTLVSVISTLVMHKSQGKYSLYLMALAFLILFYPFPAAMVLFWTMMNLLHLVTTGAIRLASKKTSA